MFIHRAHMHHSIHIIMQFPFILILPNLKNLVDELSIQFDAFQTLSFPRLANPIYTHLQKGVKILDVPYNISEINKK